MVNIGSENPVSGGKVWDVQTPTINITSSYPKVREILQLAMVCSLSVTIFIGINVVLGLILGKSESYLFGSIITTLVAFTILVFSFATLRFLRYFSLSQELKKRGFTPKHSSLAIVNAFRWFNYVSQTSIPNLLREKVLLIALMGVWLIITPLTIMYLANL